MKKRMRNETDLPSSISVTKARVVTSVLDARSVLLVPSLNRVSLPDTDTCWLRYPLIESMWAGV